MSSVPASGSPEPVSASRLTRWRRGAVGLLMTRLLRAVDAGLCPPGALSGSGIHRIVVCRPNHRLGNTVLLGSLLRELETRYPGAEIDLLCAGPAGATLFGTRFAMRQVIALPGRMPRHPWRTLARLRQLRRERYDLAIDACPASYSGRLVLGLCHATWKLGFPLSEAAGPLQGYVEACPAHVAQRSAHLLRVACGDHQPAAWLNLDVALDDALRAQGRQVLAAVVGCGGEVGGPVVGIFPNATGAKRYPEAWWADFVAALHARRPDIRMVNVLAEHGRTQLPGTLPTLYSRDLRKLAAVLAGMDGFISGDCGVMHLASAVGTPTLGLFVQPNRDKYAPYGLCNQALGASLERGGAAAAHAAACWMEQACPGGRGEIAEADAVA